MKYDDIRESPGAAFDRIAELERLLRQAGSRITELEAEAVELRKRLAMSLA